MRTDRSASSFGRDAPASGVMTGPLLERAAVALYGQGWRALLGEATGADERSLRRWLNGTNSVPLAIEQAIRRLLEAEAADQQRRLAELRALIAVLGQ